MTQEVAIVIHVHVTSRNLQIVYTFMQIMEFDVGPLCHAFFWVKKTIVFFSQEINGDDDDTFSSFEDSELRLIPFTCDDPNRAFCCHTCNDPECSFCTCNNPECSYCGH